MNYPEIRKAIGDDNSNSLLEQGGRFRRKLRLAFDTQVYQYCANERSVIETIDSDDKAWGDLSSLSATTVSAEYPLPGELDYIYAICELARRGDAEIIKLPIVLSEIRDHAQRHGHFHGIERLDFGVTYRDYPMRCSGMSPVVSRILNVKDEQCNLDVASYVPLINHAQGGKQLKDVLAFIEADLAYVDVFISLDRKFLRPFRQIESKLTLNGIHTKVMTPSEFCEVARLRPIPFPPPNPRQARGGDPPDR